MAKKPGIIVPLLLAVWWLAMLAGGFIASPAAGIERLTVVSDLIEDSAPGGGGSHTLTFTTVTSVPAGGKIVFAFPAGGITNLAVLGVEDIDVASGSDYTVASLPSGSTLGVTYTGSLVTVTLGTGTIPAGTAMTVELGTIASYGATGDTSLLNGATAGSYTVTITTRTAGDTIIDEGEAVFVLVPPVGLSAVRPTPTPGGGGGGGASPTPTPLAGVALWPDAGSNPEVFGARVLGVAPATAPETTLTATVTNSGDLTQLGTSGTPISFVTTLGEPSVATIAAGAWEFETYAMATDAGGSTSLVAAVYIRHTDGTEELLFEHQITSDLASSATFYSTSTYQPEFTILSTDRIVLKYLTQTGGSGGPVDVTLFYQGTDRYSHILSPPYFTPLPSCFRIADFNGDCRVNITDFSILMANWGPNPRNILTDINTDGSAGIVDLSILLYWWTG